MKTKLLSFILTMVLVSSMTNAQTKTWDFSNTAIWPVTASGVGTIGPDTSAVIDNLGLFSNDPSATNDIINFGAINANNGVFTDGYTGTNRFQLNGGGGGTAGNLLPTQRYLFFNVSGACTVTVWFKTGSNGSTRNVFVTNGTTLLGSGSSNSGGNADTVIFTATISAAQASGRIYIFGDTQSSNLYKITVTGATVNTQPLANDDFQSESTVNVFTNGNQISVANIISKTQVEVYNMNGALVKSFSTDVDTSFDMVSDGVYVVNVSSAEGKKAVKVAIK